jgi:hypothetical protein
VSAQTVLSSQKNNFSLSGLPKGDAASPRRRRAGFSTSEFESGHPRILDTNCGREFSLEGVIMIARFTNVAIVWVALE